MGRMQSASQRTSSFLTVSEIVYALPVQVINNTDTGRHWSCFVMGMKTLIALILCLPLYSFASARDAQEVCPAGSVPLSTVNLSNIRAVHSLTCKTEISYDEYRVCMNEPVWRGGVMSTMCDKGRFRGCCYSRWNGNPRADWKLIRCDSIDNRDAWTAFTDLFRRN